MGKPQVLLKESNDKEFAWNGMRICIWEVASGTGIGK